MRPNPRSPSRKFGPAMALVIRSRLAAFSEYLSQLRRSSISFNSHRSLHPSRGSSRRAESSVTGKLQAGLLGHPMGGRFLGQPDAAQQNLKSGIIAQPVVARIHFEGNETIRMLRGDLFQPTE